MNNNVDIFQLIKNLLMAAGMTEEVDESAQLLLSRIYAQAFDEYIKGLDSAEAEKTLSEIDVLADNDQKLNHIMKILDLDTNTHHLESAARQVSEELSTIANQ